MKQNPTPVITLTILTSVLIVDSELCIQDNYYDDNRVQSIEKMSVNDQNYMNTRLWYLHYY